MTVIRKVWSGGDGAAVATGGGMTVITASAGTLTYNSPGGFYRDNDVAVQSQALAAADQANAYFDQTPAAWGSFQVYVIANADPTGAAAAVAGMRAGTAGTNANACLLARTTAGGYVVQDAAGVNRITLPSVAIGTIARIEVDCFPGSSTTTGQCYARVYDNSDAQIGTEQSFTGNFGGGTSTNIIRFRFGDVTTATVANSDFTFGPIAFDAASTRPSIPPVGKIVKAPLVDVGDSFTVEPGAPAALHCAATAQGTATIPGNSSYVWTLNGNQVDTGPDIQITGPLTSAGGILVYTCTVTDSTGATGSDTANVTYAGAARKVTGAAGTTRPSWRRTAAG